MSNESIIRSCASLGLTTQTIATVAYLALPASAVAGRTRPASGMIRPYEPGDCNKVAELPRGPRRAAIEARHDLRDYDHRFLAEVARTYVLPRAGGIAALAHFASLEVRDGGRLFRNAYLRDFEPGELTPQETEQFLADVLRALASEPCHLIVAPATACSPTASLAALGFRRTGQKLNLLATALRGFPSAESVADSQEIALDVY